MDGELTRQFDPHFKPAFNLDLLLSNNYICHFTVLRASLFEQLMLRKDYDGAQDYDLFLRAVLGIEWNRVEEGGSAFEYGMFPVTYMKKKIGHVPRILYHWRAHEESTSDNPESKRYAYEAGKRALEDFCRQLDWKVTVSHTRHLGFYRIGYQPDVLAVRKDIWGVCGRRVRGGKVSEGPVLDGVSLFEGMNFHYSGYLHRAALMLDVDSAPEDLIRRRRKRGPVYPDPDRRLLYLPELFIR